MWWHHGAWGAGDWVAASLLMLLFWAVVVGGIVVLVRSLADRRGTGGTVQPDSEQPPVDNARRILDERFARGELTEEEYTRRRSVLSPR